MAVAEFVRCGTGTQLSYDQSDQGFVFPPIARVARTAATCADLTPRTGGGAAPFRIEVRREAVKKIRLPESDFPGTSVGGVHPI